MKKNSESKRVATHNFLAYHGKGAMSRNVLNFRNVNNKIGVFQMNVYTNPNFVSFKGSSYSDGSHKNASTVLSDDSQFFQTEPLLNSTFTVSFKYHKFKLSGFSLKSCELGNCVYNIKIFGSNDENMWIDECDFNKGKEYFKTEIKFAECKSKNFYKHYKMQQVGSGMNENYYFPLYYLEFFGDMKYQECLTIKYKRQNASNHALILVLLLSY